MIVGFKTVNLALINQFAAVGYTWLFDYETTHSHEKGMHVPQMSAYDVIMPLGVCSGVVRPVEGGHGQVTEISPKSSSYWPYFSM